VDEINIPHFFVVGSLCDSNIHKVAAANLGLMETVGWLNSKRAVLRHILAERFNFVFVL